MKSFTYTITDPMGIHARPAGMLVKEASSMAGQITIKKGDKSADAKRLLNLMGLGIKCGEEVTVTVEGDNEEADAAALEKFFKENL